MSIEQADKPNFEVLLEKKEPRLPKSVRTYIRRLKQDGNLQQALTVRETAIKTKRTRDQKAQDELDKTVSEMLITQNPNLEASRTVKTIWLLYATGDLTQKQRNDEINDFLNSLNNKAPEIVSYLDTVLPNIRDEVIPLLPHVQTQR